MRFRNKAHTLTAAPGICNCYRHATRRLGSKMPMFQNKTTSGGPPMNAILARLPTLARPREIFNMPLLTMSSFNLRGCALCLPIALTACMTFAQTPRHFDSIAPPLCDGGNSAIESGMRSPCFQVSSTSRIRPKKEKLPFHHFHVAHSRRQFPPTLDYPVQLLSSHVQVRPLCEMRGIK